MNDGFVRLDDPEKKTGRIPDVAEMLLGIVLGRKSFMDEKDLIGKMPLIEKDIGEAMGKEMNEVYLSDEEIETICRLIPDSLLKDRLYARIRAKGRS